MPVWVNVQNLSSSFAKPACCGIRFGAKRDVAQREEQQEVASHWEE